MAPVDKTKLTSFFEDKDILQDEKDMWMRLGFFIYSESTATSENGYKRTLIRDAAGIESPIAPSSAKNIRQAVMEWWTVEKVKPRLEEPKRDSSGLDALENRNAI